MLNRKIKFRVWDTLQNIWISTYGKREIIDGILNLDYPDYWILQQFTNLKDFNSKEIYEGDIVKIHEEGSSIPILIKSPLVVTYNWGGFRIDGNNIDNWIMNEMDAGFDIVAVEVIGNMFENPELLKLDEKTS